MLQAREKWSNDGEGAEVVAFPRATADARREFGRNEPARPSACWSTYIQRK
jgi:hypothetical protein